MPCNANELAEVELFELISEEDLKSLAEVVDSTSLKANEILFHAGEPGEALYIVRTGEVELFIKDTTGQKIVLTIAGKNDMFGEVAMFDSKPRTATAMALTDAELLVVEREDLIFLFQKNPDTALSMMAAIGGMLRRADELLMTRVSRNVNEEMEEKLSPLQRFSDWIAWFSGSMQFLLLNLLMFVIWITVNIQIFRVSPFDPFPFGFLTMITSLESIFLSCFVLISQNRQAEKDRVRSDIEYDVNIKAELEVAHLHEKTDRIYESMLERFARLEKTMSGRSKTQD
jgi:CRP/FNR family cyclic AMP-dependent transcriptional regulator